MEHGQDTRYLPVVFKKGQPTGDALATAEQLGCIARFLDESLRELAGELKSGSIEADPYYRSQQENACLWCEYRDACFFTAGRDKRNYALKMKYDRVYELMREKEAEHGKA